jgi:hypothetical protein
VDPNAEADLPIFGQRIVGGPESLLHLHGGLNRIHSAWELRQHAVPCCIGDPASMLADEPVHDFPMRREGPQRPNFVNAHEPRVALHVCRKDSRETPLNLRTGGSDHDLSLAIIVEDVAGS